MGKLYQKAVVVSVYVEKPNKKKISSNIIKNGGTIVCKGRNRRAELLLYSRRLRESARWAANSLPSPNVASVRGKPKQKKTSTCPGNWEIFNLNFCRSLTSVQIKKPKKERKHTGSLMPMLGSLEVRKKRGFASKFMSMLQKHR